MHTQVVYAPAFQRPSGKLYSTADQLNLVHGTPTLVSFDSVKSGFSDGIEDLINEKITPGVAGLYYIHGQVKLTNVVADKSYEINIYDTLTNIAGSKEHTALAEDLILSVSVLRWCTTTSYIRLFATSNAGVNTVDIKNGEENTFLEVQRVR